MPNKKAIGVAFEDQAIVGGSVDDSPVGATTPSTGAFSGLNSTGANNIASTSASTLGFFGASAAAQPAFSAFAAVATTAAINSSISSSCFGFTSAQATALVALANGLRAALVTLGIGAT